MNDFAVRKNKIQRNVKNEVTQQEFVCFRQGSRDIRFVNDGLRQNREPKAETRCGCEAEMRVHVHSESGRWIILYFQEVYNHKFLEDRLTCMLSGHRKMDVVIVKQMNMMLKVGIIRLLCTLSPLHDLEMSASNKLTKEIFFLFSPMLFRTCTLKVQTHALSQTCDIYTLSRSINTRKEWQVGRYCDNNIFKCSCLRMESLGIPCDHIIAVLIHVQLSDTPDSLVLDRWSKNARSKVRAFVEKAPFCWDSTITLDAE
ncbi:hypothetical protein Ahy_B02g058838 [Arachis hypogaea]|uniref:Protein FAR1-RELATED SEQUENCE n=1 Tax=Arachis hypogaea TaxID=3818 RepID=A0A445AFH8_ARAHY|nr:hypothetical protein Ahy_B02g058838 [Arachis hypogaea]